MVTFGPTHSLRTGLAALWDEREAKCTSFIKVVLPCERLQECTGPFLKQGLWREIISFVRPTDIAGRNRETSFQPEKTVWFFPAIPVDLIKDVLSL